MHYVDENGVSHDVHLMLDEDIFNTPERRFLISASNVQKGRLEYTEELKSFVELGKISQEKYEELLEEGKRNYNLLIEEERKQIKQREKRNKIIKCIFCAIIGIIIAVLTSWATLTFAHSGRTDSNGGHRDNNNVSGLGYYHYHCGGYPAHLHSNGYCPYESGGYSSSSSSSKSSSTSSSKFNNEKYNDGYNDGYDHGYDVGYNKGRNAGVSSTREIYESKLEEQQNKYKNTVIAFSSTIGIMFAAFIWNITNKRQKEDE